MSKGDGSRGRRVAAGGGRRDMGGEVSRMRRFSPPGLGVGRLLRLAWHYSVTCCGVCLLERSRWILASLSRVGASAARSSIEV